tara:strand:+ start:23047 stop:23196 length:150 start_codon:yes stop_codon:yes gene_type:complete
MDLKIPCYVNSIGIAYFCGVVGIGPILCAIGPFHRWNALLLNVTEVAKL